MEEREFKETSLARFVKSYFEELKRGALQIGAAIVVYNIDKSNKECLNQLKNEFRHFFHRFERYTVELKAYITDELHLNTTIDTDYLFRRIEEDFTAIIVFFRQDVSELEESISINDSEWKDTTQPREIYLHNAAKELERYRDDIMQLKKPSTGNKKSKSATNKKSKKITNFLLSGYPAELMNKLHELLDSNDSGKHVATVKAALVKKGYLQKTARITPTLIAEFNLQCSDYSINKYTPWSWEVEAIVNLLP
ncbi:MAG: DUF6043 family protein [Bacteroidales bacterium]|jgi:hypothetical protein|nr:DUF6043 family protein [Bacteroidales bacterium]